MLFKVTFSLADFINGEGTYESFLVDVPKAEVEKLVRLQGRETRFGRIECVIIEPHKMSIFPSLASLLKDRDFRAVTGLDGKRGPEPEQLLKSIQQDPPPPRAYKSREQLSQEINEALNKPASRKKKG